MSQKRSKTLCKEIENRCSCDVLMYMSLVIVILMFVCVSPIWAAGFAILGFLCYWLGDISIYPDKFLCCSSTKATNCLNKEQKEKMDAIIEKAHFGLDVGIKKFMEMENPNNLAMSVRLVEGKGVNLSILKCSPECLSKEYDVENDPDIKRAIKIIMEALKDVDFWPLFEIKSKPWKEIKVNNHKYLDTFQGLELKWRFKARIFEDDKGHIIHHIGSKTPKSQLSS